MLRPFSLVCLLTLVVAGLGGVGCGADSGSDRPDERASLLLDFAPNGVHAGIYVAVGRGFDQAEGVDLRVRKPGASTDALRLLQASRVDMAILDIHDLGLARQSGADLVGVMAIVQRPLAALLADPSVASPRRLEGERVGVTGLPSDEAVLRSIVSGDGGDPARVRETTIGFEAVPALLAGRVAAATAFWNVEGVALRRRRPSIREFRVEDYGAPPYPELVLAVTRETLEDRRPVVRAAIRALQRGYTEAIIDPASAVAAMVARERGLDEGVLAEQLDAVGPAFTAGAGTYGALRLSVLRRWAAWDVEFGILSEPPDVERAFDTTLIGRLRR